MSLCIRENLFLHDGIILEVADYRVKRCIIIATHAIQLYMDGITYLRENMYLYSYLS